MPDDNFCDECPIAITGISNCYAGCNGKLNIETKYEVKP